MSWSSYSFLSIFKEKGIMQQYNLELHTQMLQTVY